MKTIPSLRKKCVKSKQNLARSTKEFAYYMVNQIFGLFKEFDSCNQRWFFFRYDLVK